jgi:hypothetical protein
MAGVSRPAVKVLQQLRYDPMLYEAVLRDLRATAKTRLAGRRLDIGGLHVYQPA